MTPIDSLKGFVLGRQVYRLNGRPIDKNTLIYPLVDTKAELNLVLSDLAEKCERITLMHLKAVYTPRMISKHIDNVLIKLNLQTGWKNIVKDFNRKFKFITLQKMNVAAYQKNNLFANTEIVHTYTRNVITMKNKKRFLKFMDDLFDDVNSYSMYSRKFMLIPLDLVPLPVSKTRYTEGLMRNRNSSLASLMMYYIKIAPEDFMRNMRRTDATLLFYSGTGTFKISAKDLEERVIVSFGESISISDRSEVKLFGECEATNSETREVFKKLYSEVSMVKEDKIVDVTLAGVRRLKGKGNFIHNVKEPELTPEELKDEDTQETELIAKVLDSSIPEDRTMNPEQEKTISIISDKFDEKDNVVVGKIEDGSTDLIRVKEIRTTKEKAENIQDTAKAKLINTIVTNPKNAIEVQEASYLAEILVTSQPNSERVVNAAKRLKDVKLNRTRQYNPKEKKYLERVNELTASQEIASVEQLKIEPVSFVDVDAFDDIAENKFVNFDKTYENTLRKKDLYGSFAQLSKSNDFPLYINKVTEEDISDKYNNMVRVKATLKDPNGKTQTISVKEPKLEGNIMTINGTKLELQAQRILKPVVKFGDSVIITMNYNKAFVESSGKYISRYESMIGRFSDRITSDAELKKKVRYIEFGMVDENDEITKTIEFVRIGRHITKIYKDDDNFIFFRNEDCKAYFTDKAEHIDGDYEGFDSPNEMRIGRINGVELRLNKERDIIVSRGDIPQGQPPIEIGDSVGETLLNFINYIGEDPDVVEVLNGLSKKTALSYSVIKIMSRKLPVALVLSYTDGLDEVLKESGVEYSIIYDDKKPKYDPLKEEVLVFKDCYVKYSTVKIEHSLLFAGLLAYDLSDFKYVDFCDTSSGLSASIIDSIGNGNLPMYVTSFKLLFVDSMSQEPLEHYNLPNNFLGVLLYANMLLATDIRMKDDDMRLYRIRRAECIQAATNKVISDAYAKYLHAKMRGSRHAKVEVQEDAVIRALYDMANVNTYSTVNPIVSAISKSKVTVKGPSGMNLDRAFTLEKRKLNVTSAGIIAMPSVYSGSIGIVNQMPIDPKIVSPRGYLEITPVDEIENLSAKELLSPTELITPGVTEKDDPMRTSINLQQKGHMVGVENPVMPVITNGYDEMLGRMAPEFCHYAEKDGRISRVTTDYIFVEYNDGLTDAFRIDNVERHSAKAKLINNKMRIMKGLKQGTRFKAGDPLAYNENMFVEYDGKPIFCLGTKLNLAIMSAPGAYEDATIISESAARKLASKSYKSKVIILDKNTMIDFALVRPKLKVRSSDILLTHILSSRDEGLDSILANQEEIDKSMKVFKKAGVAGTIHSINIAYCCKKSELSSTMARFVSDVTDEYDARGDRFAAATTNSKFKSASLDRSPSQVKEGTKVSGVKIQRDQVVIEYVIETISIMGHADKLTYFNALKGETSVILPDDKMPVGTQSGIRIDAILSPKGPSARKVMSFTDIGSTERLVMELFKRCQEMLNIKK